MSFPVPLSPSPLNVVLFSCAISAGFPSPAADHTQKRINLTDELVLHPEATFLFRITGDSMINAGIFDGDAVLVDRAIEAAHDLIVLAVIDGEFTCKRLYKRGKIVKLLPENDAYQPIEFAEGQEVTIWGVVTESFRNHFKPQKKRNAKKGA